MTTTELPDTIAHLVGERVHGLDPAGIVVLLEPGDEDFFAFPKTTTLGRGQELVLTEPILLASLDRVGNSIWALDEYQQRDRWNGSPRWGFGEYPESEKDFDRRTFVPDDGKYRTASVTVADYAGNTEPRGIRASLRNSW